MYIPTSVLFIFFIVLAWIFLNKTTISIKSKSALVNNFDDGADIKPNLFYDVVAKEIIKLRRMLMHMSIEQDSHGWDKYFTKEYMYKMRLYSQYDKHYIQKTYTPSGNENERGGVILIVGDDIFGDICKYKEEIDIHKLLILHNGSENVRKFRKGSTIWLYLEEKDVYVELGGPLRAEILSIKERSDIDYEDVKLELRIDLNSDQDPYPYYSTPTPNYITRTIELYGRNNYFIDDKIVSDC